MDFETFAAKHDASRHGFGDAGMHMSTARMGKSTWKRHVKNQMERDAQLAARRDELRREFETMKARGEVREPTAQESLEATAKGNPERSDVQAAMRVIAKRLARMQAALEAFEVE